MSPQSCLVIEDSFPGRLAGSCAGMRAVAIRSKYTSSLRFPQASLVIESPESPDARKPGAFLLKG